MSIFVSFAAYRDPEIVPSVLDCLAKAENPDDLHIVICWQYAEGEDVSALRGDPRIEIIEVPYLEAKGTCWARAEIMKRYAGEDFYAQYDSHTRFNQNWDTRLIKAAAATGAEKPVLSTYPPGYDPEQPDQELSTVPTQMDMYEFDRDGLPHFRGAYISGWESLTAPVPGRFVSGNLLFAPGSLVREVPYDPDLYFFGEEITVAVRAWTWGYDLFHPHEVTSYHYYGRPQSRRHWDDHGQAVEGKTWGQRHRTALRRTQTMLRHPSTGRVGFGTVRSVAEYQEWAGIDFRRRTFVSDWL